MSDEPYRAPESNKTSTDNVGFPRPIWVVGLAGAFVSCIGAFVTGLKHWKSGESIGSAVVAFSSSLLLAFALWSLLIRTRALHGRAKTQDRRQTDSTVGMAEDE